MSKKIGLYKERTCKGVQWRVRWFGQYDPNTGKQRRYGKTFALRKDAERCLKAKETEFDQGTLRDPSNETLKQYSERWLHNKVKIQGVRPATVELYRQTFDRLHAHFGQDCLLRIIDRQMAENFLANVEPLRPNKDTLSAWSRHRILRHCKTIFKDAVETGVIAKNPFNGLKGPKCVTSQWYYLKPDEYRKLLDVTTSLREKVLYALCFTAGLRETEALTLRWIDVDFEKGRIHIVNQKATETLPPFDIKDLDARTIPMLKHTGDLLTSLQVESPDGSPYILITGERYSKVCDKWQQLRKQGKPWLPRYWANNVIKKFHRRIRQAGIDTAGKELTIHVLRKCCIQNWRNNLPENVVKAWGGHTNSETMDRFYSTVDEIHFDAAVKFGDNLFMSALTDRKMTFSPVFEPNQDVGCPK